jgi:hypothetical protein
MGKANTLEDFKNLENLFQNSSELKSNNIENSE